MDGIFYKLKCNGLFGNVSIVVKGKNRGAVVHFANPQEADDALKVTRRQRILGIYFDAVITASTDEKKKRRRSIGSQKTRKVKRAAKAKAAADALKAVS